MVAGGLEQALVLALPVDGAGPLDRVAGLPLALRTVLTLQREGVRRVELAVAPGDEATGDAVRRDPRVRVELRVRPAEGRARAIAESELEGPFLVAAHDAVAAPKIYAALLRSGAERGSVVVPAEGDVPLVVVSKEAFRGATEDVEALLARWRTDGSAAVLAPSGWLASAKTEEGRRRAVYELFEACRKPVDGIVSRHLNRHVSIFVSKLLVDTPVKPNAISLVCLSLGFAAAWFVAQGSYQGMVTGAALLQLNSILDGVDGELARVRFEGSKAGEWLDTVSDDLSNALFYGGLAYGSRGLPHPGPLLAWAGFAAVGFALVTMFFYYLELVRLGRGDFYALDTGASVPRSGLWGALDKGARYVLKKDFFVFAFFVAAVCGALPWALPVALAGTIATAVTGIRIAVRRALA